MQQLYDLYDKLNLSIGDLLIDVGTNHRGFLLKRERYIDMFDDDIWLWEIHWFTFNSKESLDNPINSVTIMEEENLKFAILIGRTEWYSIKGETWNAEKAQLECIQNI